MDLPPYSFAKLVFDRYAAMDAPELPRHPMSALQVRLFRWQAHNFNPGGIEHNVLGVNEELGELVEALLGLMSRAGRLDHAVLKHMQKIRGFENEDHFRRQAADAVADMMIFATQICTTLRLDLGALYDATAEEVMKREWKKKREEDPSRHPKPLTSCYCNLCEQARNG